MDNENFDDEWINKFENEEKKYDVFYPKELQNLKINCLYINKINELEKITEKNVILNKSNKIKKEELIQLIKDNDKIDRNKYKLISILVYNFNLESNELKNFLKNSDSYEFLNSLKNIDDFTLDSSINYFHNINSLYIIYSAIEKSNNVNTKRVRFNIQKGKTRRKKH